MRILVTGGAGFIGSHVVDLLIKGGHEVYIIDNLSSGKKSNVNPQAHLFNLDICSSAIEEVFANNLDVVIHLAAQVDVNTSIDDPLHDAEVNILGSLRVLELCRKNQVKKIIYGNSAAETGDPQYLPVDEQHPINPKSPYGLSKNIFSRYLKIYQELYGINYISLRFSNVYGPRQTARDEGGVIPLFVNNILQGKDLIIYGDGTQTRDFVYVGDVARAIVQMLDSSSTVANTTYNIGTGIKTSINKLVEMLKNITQREIKFSNALPREGDIMHHTFSINKISSEIGWTPKINFEEGLRKTIENLKNEP